MLSLDRELDALIARWRTRTSEEVIRAALRRASQRMQEDNPPPSRPDPNHKGDA